MIRFPWSWYEPFRKAANELPDRVDPNGEDDKVDDAFGQHDNLDETTNNFINEETEQNEQ